MIVSRVNAALATNDAGAIEALKNELDRMNNLGGGIDAHGRPYFLWDEDVTVTGVAATYEHALNNGSLTATVGAFFLPDGGYQLNGQLVGAQLKYTVSMQAQA